METKKQILSYIEIIQKFSFGILFLVFPLFFTTITTDPFILPKEAILGFFILLSFLLFGIQIIVEKKIRIRQTFLDLPIFVFILALFLSSIFAVNRIDSITGFIPIFFLGIAYFLLTNIIRSPQTAFFIISSLLLSSAITSLIAVFSYFKVYLLPFASTHVQSFTTMASIFNQMLYFAGILPIGLYFSYPLLKGKADSKTLNFAVLSFIILSGFILSLYQLFTVQKPTLLPYIVGFQIAFAAISQDSPRIAKAFFFGSGIGTFLTDFTRFKQANFNLNQNLWYQLFYQSSSFVLELLSTTGILGILSYLFIAGKTISKSFNTVNNPTFISVVTLIILSFIFPFSFTTLSLFFFILALFTSIEGLKHPEKSVDLEFSLVALRKNLFNPQHEEKPTHHTSLLMPIVFFIIIVSLVSVVGFYSTTYILGDIFFNQSITAAAKNNGSQTYQKQVEAINIFPYRDSFYRIFSQTNISLANALLILANNNKSGNAQNQTQTALSLIQQAINSARTATIISPQTTLNWQNLASVYRTLIGFGQNAESFSIASINQAIAVDPTNPQEYLTLGGLYYQLGQYDNAINQFQTTVNLKADYANGYYNLGHAYEQKGDLQNALNQYQVVKQLTANDPNNLQKITSEIDALNKKIGSQNQTNQKPIKNIQPVSNQEPLNVNQSSEQLPKQQQQIPLPSSITPSPGT